MALICSSCGNSVPEGTAFCTECGTKISQEPVVTPAEQAEEIIICQKCGAVLEQGQAFCTSCGTQKNRPAEVPPVPVTPPKPISPPKPVAEKKAAPVTPTAVSTEPNLKGTKYEPISTGGFFGILLIMGIPVIGLIFTIVWACGGCRKVNKRSYARAVLLLTVIGLVLSLILVLVAGSLLSSLLPPGTSLPQIIPDDVQMSVEDEKSDSPLDGLEIFAGLEDIQDLNDLEALAELMEGFENSTDAPATEGDFNDLIENIEQINKEAEQYSDGWPEELPPYPNGKAESVESYRTVIAETSLEVMLEYIETLKANGFAFQDFYDFGFSEEDMLSMNGWWGTNGTLYLSFSYYEGTVTVDHTYELPDLSSYF